jgi:hypothetical protein
MSKLKSVFMREILDQLFNNLSLICRIDIHYPFEVGWEFSNYGIVVYLLSLYLHFVLKVLY